jgi:hypothetical protein
VAFVKLRTLELDDDSGGARGGEGSRSGAKLLCGQWTEQCRVWPATTQTYREHYIHTYVRDPRQTGHAEVSKSRLTCYFFIDRAQSNILLFV